MLFIVLGQDLVGLGPGLEYDAFWYICVWGEKYKTEEKSGMEAESDERGWRPDMPW